MTTPSWTSIRDTMDGWSAGTHSIDTVEVVKETDGTISSALLGMVHELTENAARIVKHEILLRSNLP